ncbi:MAG: hypothetical protein ACK4HW_08635 [Roseinatronobacter sp.]
MIQVTRKFGDTFRLQFHTSFALDDVEVTATARDSSGQDRPLGITYVDLPERRFEIWLPDGQPPLPVGRHMLTIHYRHPQHSATVSLQLRIAERITP